MTTSNSETCRNPGCKYVSICQFANNKEARTNETTLLPLSINQQGLAVFPIADDINGVTVREATILLDRIDEYKGVLVYVNSPGGYHGPAEEVTKILKEVSRTVPIISYIKFAASAGLTVALASDEIYAAKDASAGGLGSHYFVCFEGKTPSSVVSAISTAKKIDLNGGPNAYEPQPYTDKARTEIQEICDNSLAKTFQYILENRETSIRQLAPLADGSRLDAESLVKAGLVDGVIESDEALKKIKDMIRKVTINEQK